MVACDPVMCHALAARGVPPQALDPLGPGPTSPLRSEIIVVTAQARAREMEQQVDREWEQHLGKRRMAELRRTLADLRQITDPWA